MPRYSVGVVKIPHAERDLVHRVLADDGRGFLDVIGADTRDDDERFPVGAKTVYSLELTEAEAREFAEASNVRYVVLDDEDPPLVAANVPDVRSRIWLGEQTVNAPAFPGTGTRIAILDQGVTSAVRNYMNYTQLDRTVIDTVTPPAGEIHPGQRHGCLTASSGVPRFGQLLDCNIVSNTGASSPSRQAAGIAWALDRDADIINISFGGLNTDDRYAPVRDALDYMANFDCVLFCAAGNDADADIFYPAAFSRSYDFVHSVIAFDERTDDITSFSTSADWASGCAPGINIRGLDETATEVLWQGTSAASPMAARVCARVHSAGGTIRAASAALKANLRDTGRGAVQGGGAYHLERTLVALGAIPSRTPLPARSPLFAW